MLSGTKAFPGYPAKWETSSCRKSMPEYNFGIYNHFENLHKVPKF